MPDRALRAPPQPTAVSLLLRLRRMSIVMTPYDVHLSIPEKQGHRGDRSTLMLIVFMKVE